MSAGRLPAGDPGVRPVASWGRLSSEPHRLHPLRDRSRIDFGPAGDGPVLPYGNGRSYGDACLNPGGRLLTTRGLDRFIAFDAATGLLECEAGVLLDDIIAVALPRGWFLPVTPGTRFATLGGAVANDVHGKNHHRAGTLGEHVRSLLLAAQRRQPHRVQPDDRAEWFAATVGGLGLTGVIVERAPAAAWRCRASGSTPRRSPSARSTSSSPCRATRERDWEYTVAWIDCIHGGGAGRAASSCRANHSRRTRRAAAAAPSRTLPVTPPVSLVNGASLRALQRDLLPRSTGGARGAACSTCCPSSIRSTACASGTASTARAASTSTSASCRVPSSGTRRWRCMHAIRASGQGSFLAVLKTFDERPAAGMLSFPMAGTTLALDFPNGGADAPARCSSASTRSSARPAGASTPPRTPAWPRASSSAAIPRLTEFLPLPRPRHLLGDVAAPSGQLKPMTPSPVLRVLVVGATSAIADAVARRYAARGARLLLLGRRAPMLEVAAADLRVRGAAEVAVDLFEADDVDSHPAIVSRAWDRWQGFDVALVATACCPTRRRHNPRSRSPCARSTPTRAR